MKFLKIALIIFVISTVYFFVADVRYTCTFFKNKLGCYNGNLEWRFNWLGVENSQNYLKKLYDKGFLTQGQCHTLGHKIGQNAVRSGTGMIEAMEEKNFFCGWAFFHGVMEGLFGEGAGHGKISVDEVIQICEKKEYKNNAEVVNCFHALGHSFYVIDPDFNNILNICDKISDSIRRGYCYDGVFMSMTFPKEGPRVKEDDIDSLSVCSQIGETRKPFCYWRLVPVKVFIEELELPSSEYVLEISKKIPDNFKSIFWNGFGRELDSRFASDSRIIKTGCQWGSDQNLSCVEGAGMHMIFYDRDNRDRAVELCRAVLEDENQAQCVDDMKNKIYPGL